MQIDGIQNNLSNNYNQSFGKNTFLNKAKNARYAAKRHYFNSLYYEANIKGL